MRIRRKGNKVVVLGCGPAGLIAAHAARVEFDADVIILSVKRKSPIFGCQYLHDPIPYLGMNQEYETVDYQLHGTVEGYREKVYGSLTPSVSPQQYQGKEFAWDIRKAYDALWNDYEHLVEDVHLSPSSILPALDFNKAKFVVSSIPLPFLCQAGSQHTFSSVKCWAIGDGDTVRVPVRTKPFTVVCDGTKEVSWYRSSNVFGSSTVEWPGHRTKPPISGIVEFQKPLVSNCDCLMRVQRVGRFGHWRKGVLAHHAYEETVNYLSSDGQTDSVVP